MDMTLSKRGDYVMKSAIYLARAWAEGISAGYIKTDRELGGTSSGFIDEKVEGEISRKIREIVKDTSIPSTFAPQILADLIRAGLAVSKAGRFGGYRLSRDPALISALEVVEAAEGSLRADRCALGEDLCRWEDVCPLHETWILAGQAVAKVLQETTLAELAARDIAIENGTYKLVTDAHRSHPMSIDISDKVQIELNLMKVSKGILALSGTKEAERLLNDSYKAALTTLDGLRVVAAQSDKLSTSGNSSFSLAQKTKSVTQKKSLITEKSSKAGFSEAANSEITFLWKGNSTSSIENIEGRISLSVVDEERTELFFEAKLRQPSREPLLSKEYLTEVSSKFIRNFLKRLAALLESSA